MRVLKIYRPFLLLIVLAPLCSYSQTVGPAPSPYAGQDKTICRGGNVVIGNATCPGCCYSWEPTTGLDNPNTSHPLASPESTTNYKLTITGPSFNFKVTDDVTITVDDKDFISSITANSIRCCWSSGESINIKDFSGETSPPGLFTTLKVEPSAAPGFPGVLTEINFDYPVKIYGECAGHRVEVVVPIVVVNKDFKVTTKSEIVKNVLEPVNANVKQVIDFVANFGTKVGLPCIPRYESIVDLELVQNKLCCKDKPSCTDSITDQIKIKLQYSAEAGVDCEILIPPPYNLGLPLKALIGGAIKASISAEGEKKCEDLKLCGNVDFSGKVSGGVKLDVVPKVIEASLKVEFELKFPQYKLCVYPGPIGLETQSPYCPKGKLVGNVKFASFMNRTGIEYVFYDPCSK